MTLSTRFVHAATTLVLATATSIAMSLVLIPLAQASNDADGDPWENERVGDPTTVDPSSGAGPTVDTGTASQIDDGDPWENERLAGILLEQALWLARAMR